MTTPREPGQHDWESGEHRANCAQCRAEHQQLESALAGFRALARETSDRPEHFWQRQRLAVRERLQEAPRRRRYGSLAWVSAAALVLLTLVVFAPHSEPVVPDIAAGQDQDLLVGIERSLDRNLPQALEPGLVLTQEMESPATQSTGK